MYSQLDHFAPHNWTILPLTAGPICPCCYPQFGIMIHRWIIRIAIVLVIFFTESQIINKFTCNQNFDVNLDEHLQLLLAITRHRIFIITLPLILHLQKTWILINRECQEPTKPIGISREKNIHTLDTHSDLISIKNGFHVWDVSWGFIWNWDYGGLASYDETKKQKSYFQGDIKLLGSLDREDLKKLCGDNFPEWISFPVYEQVKWLNKQLSKLWPYVAEAATIIIRESVEPILEEYRPSGISSLKFSKLSLGSVAPKIEGIRIQSPKKGQISMDMDFRWGGDPNIVLGVEAAGVASLPIQVNNRLPGYTYPTHRHLHPHTSFFCSPFFFFFSGVMKQTTLVSLPLHSECFPQPP
ncbi:unnamed protein product [Lactuca virosa]|uniref:SMP-LTD domain-containing protein n=1 Tax=Lactuca virosa TaxID=75947 RepID=A0AAU9LHZ3_9ASTR|nr:unnamed protein product [Lactuca virosa]